MAAQFIKGKEVKHVYTGESLWMLKEGREQILCRTRDLREIWFYPDELVDIQNTMIESRENRFL